VRDWRTANKLNVLYSNKEYVYLSIMTATTHLRALQAVELAIRKGSLKGAAEELAITPAAIGQRIKSLEEYLGFDLLVRGRSGIRPTPELEAALAHLGAAFRELDTVARILDFQRVHEIHISADSDWAELWLRPRLAEFREQNPNTLFCINGVGDVPVRLGEADCTVRFGADDPEAAEDLLFHDYLLPLSSPENTQRVASLPKEERLEGFPLLHLNCYTTEAGDLGWIDWIEAFGYRKTAPGRGIRYQRLVHALEAVYADAGFVIGGLALVLPQLDAGALSLAFPIELGKWSRNGYRARFDPLSLRRNAVIRFRDWLLEESGETAATLRCKVGA